MFRNKAPKPQGQQQDPTSQKSGVHVGTPSGSWWGFKRNRHLVVALLVAVVVVGAVGYLGVWHKPATKPKDIPAVTMQNNLLLNTHKYDEATAMWQEYLKGKHTDQEKIQAHEAIAAIYLNKKVVPAALAEYRQAESVSKQPNYGIDYQIAALSEQLGDSKTALDYYKRALPLLDTKDEYYSVTKRGLEAKIKSLGG